MSLRVLVACKRVIDYAVKVIVLHSRQCFIMSVLSCYRQDLPQAALPVFRLLTGRFWGFSPRRGDTLHRSRSNLAGRSGP